MKSKLITIEIQIEQNLTHKKLSKEQLTFFEQSARSPDLCIENEALAKEGKATIESRVSSLTVSNVQKLEVTRTILVRCSFEGAKSVVAVLEDDFVLENGQWDALDVERFMRCYVGDWEGIFIDDEMIDLDSDVAMLSIT